jgi:hypothetical protein
VGPAFLRVDLEDPPQVLRVVDFIGGRKKTRKLRKGEAPAVASKSSKRTRQALARAVLGTGKGTKPTEPAAPQMIVEEFGGRVPDTLADLVKAINGKPV